MKTSHSHNIEITPPSQVPSKRSIDNPDRQELLWEKREEKLLQEWKKEMIQKSKYHLMKGKRFKKLYMGFGIPATLLPLIMGGINGTIEVESYILSSLMVLSGIITGIQNFINFSKKSQLHLEYENKYGQLSLEIDSELCKPKKNRMACDLYLERIKQQYQNLNQQAPL